MVMMEQIVLLDDAGRAIGSAEKAASHHRDTPLHLAFSCHVFDAADRVLLTRRAAVKRTWPGVWTNSFCGHPGPGEGLSAAVYRRARSELGVEVSDLRLVLPGFRYRAVMDDGTVEHECCPVVTARLDDQAQGLAPDPAEVADVRWCAWGDALSIVAGETSPWFALQRGLLAEFGAPSAWPPGDPRELPEAIGW